VEVGTLRRGVPLCWCASGAPAGVLWNRRPRSIGSRQEAVAVAAAGPTPCCCQVAGRHVAEPRGAAAAAAPDLAPTLARLCLCASLWTEKRRLR